MELKDTIQGMLSEDYRERFIAEYWQVKIRHDKLKEFINKIDLALLLPDEHEMPEHNCPVNMLKKQLEHMMNYMCMLEARAVVEHIDLGPAEEA